MKSSTESFFWTHPRIGQPGQTIQHHVDFDLSALHSRPADSCPSEPVEGVSGGPGDDQLAGNGLLRAVFYEANLGLLADVCDLGTGLDVHARAPG